MSNDIWQIRHNAETIKNSQGGNLYRMATALSLYLEAMERETHYKGAEDHYCAPYLEDIANGLIGLLSANIGRLDAGTVDGEIRTAMINAGFDTFA